MDEHLKNRLKVLFGTVESFDIFLDYIKSEEDRIHINNRHVIEDKDLRINQGKLQILHDMKSLRDRLRAPNNAE